MEAPRLVFPKGPGAPSSRRTVRSSGDVQSFGRSGARLPGGVLVLGRIALWACLAFGGVPGEPFGLSRSERNVFIPVVPTGAV
jgi:hypothetical protein